MEWVAIRCLKTVCSMNEWKCRDSKAMAKHMKRRPRPEGRTRSEAAHHKGRAFGAHYGPGSHPGALEKEYHLGGLLGKESMIH